MAQWVKRASEWIGLGPRETDRYDDYDDEPAHGRGDERVLGDDYGDESGTYEDSGAYDDLYRHDTDEFDEPSHEHTEVTEMVPARGPQGRTPAAVSSPVRPEEPVPYREPPVEPARTADINRIIFITPKTFNEARSIGENFRDGFPVIINLSFMEHDHARRVVDFASGLIFGLNGSIEKVDNGVFLLSPHNVRVTTEDKQRIAEGFYNQS
ncbi:cell division protein SepF [Raineyella sp. W15-4]|uniref:cell division protein SepF n=1 Tax=Raineyella sp. W15-4 TaxID=3081651 RepID=UPI00295423DC|nr:cell division protein SepF [Raineyella sp. W15-4]WOQ15839.1 cell division protein SepF [Raineyella sp. W15-4]